MSAGVLTTVAIGKETTWGTPVTPTVTIPVHYSGGIKTDTDVQTLQAARGHLAKTYAAHAGKRVHEGDLEMDLLPDSVGHFLLSALGGVSSALAGGETIVYNHTLTEAEAKKSYTVEQAIGTLIYRYAGALVKTLKIGVKAGEVAVMTASMVAKSMTTGSQTTPVLTTVRPFNFKDVSVSIGGSPVPQVETLEFEYTNNLELKHTLAGSVDPQYKAVKGSEVKGKLDCYLDTNVATEFANYLAGTTRDIVLTITGDAIGVASFYKLVITIPKVTLTAAEVQITDDYNMVSISFEGIFDNVTSKLVSAVLTNLAATL